MNGQRLKQLRLARGLSLQQLAEAMGGIVTKQALSKYEQDKDEPSARVLAALSEALLVL
jgi:transcriptional regulator with XRE-family HTH domain